MQNSKHDANKQIDPLIPPVDMCSGKHVDDLLNKYCSVAVRCSKLISDDYGYSVGYQDIDTCRNNIKARCEQTDIAARTATLISLSTMILHDKNMTDVNSCLAGLTYAPTIGRIAETAIQVANVPNYYGTPTKLR